MIVRFSFKIFQYVNLVIEKGFKIGIVNRILLEVYYFKGKVLLQNLEVLNLVKRSFEDVVSGFIEVSNYLVSIGRTF